MHDSMAPLPPAWSDSNPSTPAIKNGFRGSKLIKRRSLSLRFKAWLVNFSSIQQRLPIFLQVLAVPLEKLQPWKTEITMKGEGTF